MTQYGDFRAVLVWKGSNLYDPFMQKKWIDNLWTFLAAVALVGPLALPLLWRNPHYSVRSKVAGTVGVLAFTVVLLFLAGNVFQRIFEQFQGLQAQLQSR